MDGTHHKHPDSFASISDFTLFAKLLSPADGYRLCKAVTSH